MRINKDKKVRMSKWHIPNLSREQRIYAAIDAYVRRIKWWNCYVNFFALQASLKLYHHIKQLEKPDNVEQDIC